MEPPFDREAVIDCDMFAGDYGDGERVLRNVVGRPRKPFTCHCCAWVQPAGGWAKMLTEAGPDGIETHRWCEECCIAMSLYEYDMGDAIDARESIGNAIREGLGDQEVSHRGGVAVCVMQASMLERDRQIAEQVARANS